MTELFDTAARQCVQVLKSAPGNEVLSDGDALLYTDFNPLNILLGPERAWIIDWA